MQAIILAAGMGRRLGEMTRNNTKCMIEVNGVKLIDRMLTQLSEITPKLNRVVIVVGYKAQNLIDYIGSRYQDRLSIEYIENPIYDRTNNIYSLALAKEQLQSQDTLLLESDLIFDASMLQNIVSNAEPNLALVAKYETWMDGTMVCIDDQGNILNFVPKSAFRYQNVDTYYKTVNIYKFSKEFSRNQYVPFLEAYSRAMGNNEYYEQVLRIITALDKSSIKALVVNEPWYEIDDVQDLDIAQTIFAPQNDKLAMYHKRYGGYWRFPQMLDFCYLVNPYYPTERLRSELKANFDVLLEQYPSGMAVNSLLASKNFGVKSDYILVGNGASELIKCFMENHTDGKVGVVFPTFEEYPNRLDSDSIVQYIPSSEDFKYTAQDLKDFFGNKNISTLLLINPDNPSGNYIPKEQVLSLAVWCASKGITLLVDESFVDFTTTGATGANTLLTNDILESNQNLMVMKSISKSFGVPGLRLGVFATANTELISKMKKEVAIWNINSFAEFFMQIYEKHEADYFKACSQFVVERERFYNALQQIDWLTVYPSQANYFLCKLDRYSGHQLADLLLRNNNILIKDCGNKKAFKNNCYVRIAVRDTKDNDCLISALKQL
ncbi:MAG: aminotransferase class I/II-fold pyridoxal phosphate-dependent enzyme [Bacteroidaceae bacterium]|nr:aminotransferase class I/II-fold pyridoxal phosphate-dependent enzyme [Bacteroidaceae bacterium]